MPGRIIWLYAIIAAPLFLNPAWAGDAPPAQQPPKPDFAASDARWVYDTKSDCWARDDSRLTPASFTWTGACANQRISGPGTLSWMSGAADNRDGSGGAAGPIPNRTMTGTFTGGVLNGEGDETWANGVHYHGTFKDGIFDGAGEETWPSGDHYTGQFANGKLEGHGHLDCGCGSHYEGEFKNGKYDGQAVFTGPRGAHFTGEYRAGQPYNGSGLIEYPDHSTFEGTLKDGKQEGPGKYLFAGGSSYDGNFHEGQFDGEGTYVGPDGIHYAGGFQHSAFEGHGVLTFMSGVYEGEFHGNGLTGHGVLHKPDGTTLEGDAEPAHEDPDHPSEPAQYPPISRRLSEEGRALVVYTIGTDGTVSDIKVVQSSGYQRLDEAAKDAVENLHYIPAKIGGVPVAITKDRYYTFRLTPPLPQ